MTDWQHVQWQQQVNDWKYVEWQQVTDWQYVEWQEKLTDWKYVEWQEKVTGWKYVKWQGQNSVDLDLEFGFIHVLGRQNVDLCFWNYCRAISGHWSLLF